MELVHVFQLQAALCAGFFSLLFPLGRENTKAEKAADENGIAEIV